MDEQVFAFINELSFEGQFISTNVADGLLQFLQSCSRFEVIGKQKCSFLYMSTMFIREISHGMSYASALKTISGKAKDEIMRLKMTMDKSGWSKIEDKGFSQNTYIQYVVGKKDVSLSSLAEAYEYKGLISDEQRVVIINMPMSSFGKVIDIQKVSDRETRMIDALNSDDETISYLIGQGFSMPYDRNSTKHPLPEQTILGNSSLFTKTQRLNKGAYLYERIGHNELWCLDTLHVDGAAHFEIFSMADDRWKGESYDLQTINPDYHSNKHKGSKISG